MMDVFKVADLDQSPAGYFGFEVLEIKFGLATERQARWIADDGLLGQG